MNPPSQAIMNFFRLIITSASFIVCALQAQTASSPSNSQPVEMGEVVVTSSPLGRTLFEQAQPVTVLTGQELQQNLQPTLGETLSNTPGVRSSYFGPAASRPIIRGLDGDRIRVLQNGVNTIDASATSVDHAVSFDPVSVESIEVVRGPATLLYGANAIGGVVNVTDNRIPDQRIGTALRGSLGSSYSSVDDGLSRDIMLEGGVNGLNYHLEAYRREIQDVHIPGDARSARLQAIVPLAAGEQEEHDVLANSYSTTEGFSAGASYVWDGGYIGAAYSGFDADYGSAAEKTVHIEMMQRRWDVQGALFSPVTGIKAIKYKFGFSDYTHTEFEGGAPGTEFDNEGYDGRLEITHEKFGPFEGTFGYQTERSDFSALGEEKFLPETLTRTHSGFIFEEMELASQWKLQGGLRVDHITADALSDPDFGPARNRTFNDISGSLGLIFTPSEAYAVALSATWSERAPTYQELYADGPHVATGAFEVGNDNLAVERALGFDLSLRKRTGFVTGSATIFYTRFHDFIGQFPTGETRPLDGDLLPVYEYRSTDAEFFGGELEATFHLLKPLAAAASGAAGSKQPEPSVTPGSAADTLDLELKADHVHATDTISGNPLPRISPFHTSAALAFHQAAFGARLEGIFAGHQYRVSDNELPTDAYFIVNAALSYDFQLKGTAANVYIKGVNLTNEEAREHTSFLKDIAPLAGRGFVVGMKVSF
ncbi:MAG: TonB-dependent receptor [Verrucomicrobiaceae bacterium]|nr:TonB-dependent receptor [Verrucomicrobiaceae bacterium]